MLFPGAEDGCGSFCGYELRQSILMIFFPKFRIVYRIVREEKYREKGWCYVQRRYFFLWFDIHVTWKTARHLGSDFLSKGYKRVRADSKYNAERIVDNYLKSLLSPRKRPELDPIILDPLASVIVEYRSW